MARYYGGWAPYVPVAERRKRAEREVAKLAKKGQTIAPVKIAGKRITSTFWGTAWCDNLESYRDFENRLPRGRTYVRNGSVLDLQIAPCEIRALVSGSQIYRVSISIAALPKARWQAACQDCAGGIDSLVELLQGRFSKAVMQRICQQGTGLFPNPSEIKFSCSCPDYASMCKHIAAVLYGVGARLDERPELLFQLRAVDQRALVANLDSALPLSKTRPDAAKVLADDDMSALFGLDMAVDEPAILSSPKAVKKTKPITPLVVIAQRKNVAACAVPSKRAGKAASRTSAGEPAAVPRIAAKMWKIPSSPPSRSVRGVLAGGGTAKASAPQPPAKPVPALRPVAKAKPKVKSMTKAKVPAQATTPRTDTPPRARRGQPAR